MAMTDEVRTTIRQTRINKAIEVLATSKPEGFTFRDVAELSGHTAGTITVLDEWVERGELRPFRNENGIPSYVAAQP